MSVKYQAGDLRRGGAVASVKENPEQQREHVD